MIRLVTWLFTVFAIIGLSTNVSAGDVVTIGFKKGKEPYVMASSPPKESDYDLNNDLGVEVEIVKEVFAMYGKTIRPVYMNYDRMVEQIQGGKLDAVGNIFPGVQGVYYMNKYIHLHDHIIYNSKLGENIKSVTDLAGKRVVAYQNARKYLGPNYNQAADKFKYYKEMVKQEGQVQILTKGRADAIIMDIGIFKFWAKKHAKEGDTFEFVPMGDTPFYFSIAFNDEEVMEEFSQGLEKLRANGRYDEIYNKYLN